MKFVVEIGKGIAAMSPTGRGRRNRRHRRVFRSFLAELQTEKDSMAERVGFELTGDFVADQ
jgi:hypothetical protein